MLNKKEKILNITFYISIVILSITLFCYFLDTLTNSRLLYFDYAPHFDNAVKGNTVPFNVYNLLDLIIYILSPLGYTFNLIVYCLALTISKISVIFIIKYYLLSKNKNLKDDWKINVACIALIFVEGLIPIWNWTTGYMYMVFCAPNIWHNPTILCMIPFALLSLIYLEKYYFNEEKTTKNWMLFTLFLTLGTFAKPSFLVGFIPALGVLFIIDLIRKRGKNIRHVIHCILAFIPSVLILLLQYLVLFNTDSSSGITISIGHLPILTMPLLILTPTLIYIFTIKKITKIDILVILFFVFAFIIGFFITETGARAGHGNFAWTYESAITLLFIFSTIRYICEYRNLAKYQHIIVNIAFTLNIICGIIYFLRVWITGAYA